MARLLDSLPPRLPHRSYRYPWDQWFDGQVWELVRGVDFKVLSKSFHSMAAHAAQRRHRLLTIHWLDRERTRLAMQAYPYPTEAVFDRRRFSAWAKP